MDWCSKQVNTEPGVSGQFQDGYVRQFIKGERASAMLRRGARLSGGGDPAVRLSP